MKRFSSVLFTVLLFSAFNLTASAATYNIDPGHSSVTFKIRHLFSKVTGNFNEFEGSIQYDSANPDASAAEAKIKTASIDTHVDQRDKHLRSADFFDAEKFPEITFKGTKYTKTSETAGKLEGVLNLHGVEKPVMLDVEIHGSGKDSSGKQRAGFSGTTKIDRKEFGIIWNKALDAGSVMLGDEVEIQIEIEGVEA